MHEKIVDIVISFLGLFVVPLVATKLYALLTQLSTHLHMKMSVTQEEQLRRLTDDAAHAAEEYAAGKIRAGATALTSNEKLAIAIDHLQNNLPGIETKTAIDMIKGALPRLGFGAAVKPVVKALLAILFVLALSAPTFAQTPPIDDCPAGHVLHKSLTTLDDASLVAAYRASFVGIFHREPSMQPGSGVDDGMYYVRAINHYGILGDDQCYAGWSGYWEAWLATGHGDIGLAATAARFQPQQACIQGVNCLPPPTPPSPPAPTIDLSLVLSRLDLIAATLNEHARADGDAHVAIDKNITDGRVENRGFFDWVTSNWKQLAAIIGPMVGTFEICRQTSACK